MYYYKIKIQYDGTGLAGFQWQNGPATVQSEINNALSNILLGKFSTTAASRTDTGVHAIDQIVKITSENEIDLHSFLFRFNKELPAQIKCINITTSNGLFRPSAEAVSKEYRYFFTNKKQSSKNEQDYIANISNDLNLDRMRECLQALLGENDFCNFYSTGSNVKSTIRNIIFCELTMINPHDVFSEYSLFTIPSELKECYQLRIEAKGFLKQMIRHIVSAIWMVGSGKISTETFMSFLKSSKSEKQLWKIAPANGLFLFKIKIPE